MWNLVALIADGPRSFEMWTIAAEGSARPSEPMTSVRSKENRKCSSAAALFPLWTKRPAADWPAKPFAPATIRIEPDKA